MSRPYYITTPIYYVNARPHLGHAYCTIAADVQARFRRQRGREVLFLTGTDEHGSKIEKAAAKAGITPQQLVDENSGAFRSLFAKLLISNDDFIRTTEARHKAAVQQLWELIKANNPDDIYEKEYEGFYCANCESFFPEKDLKAGKCPEFGHAVEKSKERNYFFRLSRYEKPLQELFASADFLVQPKYRLNEVAAFVATGLEDLSISRSTVKWGIPVPGDDAQTIYVWIDALTNYLSALDFGGDRVKYKKFWLEGETCHLLGKEISRFHAVYWPAFLKAANLPLPQREFIHGWILKDNQKMSKSLGNTVDADALADEFGADALRYFLMREVPLGQDGTYSDEILIERINADLANDLGNTANRLLQMTAQYRDGVVPASAANSEFAQACTGAHEKYLAAMEAFAYKEALDAVWKLLPEIGSLLQKREPWKLARVVSTSEAPAAQAELDAILGDSLNVITWLSAALWPFMPSKMNELRAQLGISADADSINGPDLRSFHWPLLSAGTQTRKGPALFPRIDKTDYLARIAKDSPMTDPNKIIIPAQADITLPTITPGSMAEGAALARGAALIEGGHPPAAELATAPPPDEEIRITIDDFLKVKLRTAVIIKAEAVEKSDKLVKLQVDLGDQQRQIVAGIRKSYAPEDLVGRRIIVVANLKPAKLMGVPSEGMLLAATNAAGEIVLLTTDPDRAAEPGCPIK